MSLPRDLRRFMQKKNLPIFAEFIEVTFMKLKVMIFCGAFSRRRSSAWNVFSLPSPVS